MNLETKNRFVILLEACRSVLLHRAKVEFQDTMQISTLKPSSYSNVFDTCVVEDLKPLNGRQEDQQACSGFGLVR